MRLLAYAAILAIVVVAGFTFIQPEPTGRVIHFANEDEFIGEGTYTLEVGQTVIIYNNASIQLESVDPDRVGLNFYRNNGFPIGFAPIKLFQTISYDTLAMSVTLEGFNSRTQTAVLRVDSKDVNIGFEFVQKDNAFVGEQPAVKYGHLYEDVYVVNKGEYPAGNVVVYFRVYEDGGAKGLSRLTIEMIEPGEKVNLNISSQEVFMSFAPRDDADYDATIELDPQNILIESNEEDNLLRKTIYFQEIPATTTTLETTTTTTVFEETGTDTTIGTTTTTMKPAGPKTPKDNTGLFVTVAVVGAAVVALALHIQKQKKRK